MPKSKRIQLRCELVVPNFALFYVDTHHTLSKEECQGVMRLRPCTVVECMWMMCDGLYGSRVDVQKD